MIYNLTKEELENYFIERNDKKFRAEQIFKWLYQKSKIIRRDDRYKKRNIKKVRRRTANI